MTELDNKVGCYSFSTHPFHCDFSSHLFMGHLGNAMLNASDLHSHERGFGVESLKPLHRTWVLSRLAIEMYDMPMAHQPFTVETWVESAMRYFTNRCYAVRTVDGQPLGFGKSVWAMIDTVDRSPVDISTVNGGIDAYVVKGRECPIDKPGRVTMTETPDVFRTIDTHYSDVDINGHINSIKYIDHILDSFDREWWLHHKLRRLEVAYVAEAYWGEQLRVYKADKTSDNIVFRLTKNFPEEKEVCRCELFFQQN